MFKIKKLSLNENKKLRIYGQGPMYTRVKSVKEIY